MIDLKKFRVEQKISQAELCTVLGIAQPYLSAIENGKRPLNEKKFTVLYKQYGDIILKYKLDKEPIVVIDEAECGLHPQMIKLLTDKYNLEEKKKEVPYEFLEVLIEERKRHDEERKRHDEMNAELIRQNGKLIQLLEESKKTVAVQKEDNATCADASGSGLEK